MRRRAFPAIVGVIVAILASVILFLVLGAGRLLPAMPPFSPAAASAPPPIPTVSGSLLPAENPQSGAMVDFDRIEKAWETLDAKAKEGRWTAWARVVDADSGDVIFAANDQDAHTPASTMKLLSGFFALSVLDPAATLQTGVSLQDSDVYLWGEGDLLLTAGEGNARAVDGHAGLSTLAAVTAAELQAQGVATVTLHYQDKLFDGPARPPGWESQDVANFGGDIAPFAIDTGRTAPGAWEFVGDSAQGVATSFADSLRKEGIAVDSIEPGMPSAEAVEIAAVESATTLDQVEFMLLTSDNTLAEQYCHLAASERAGKPLDLKKSVAELQAFLDTSQVETSGMQARDCSGLDPRTKLSPKTLTDILMQSGVSTGPESSLVRFLPVGGLSGTLAGRYDSAPGLGNVAAKTGSLGAVATLAGVVSTANGTPMIFAVGADDVPDDAAAWYRGDLDAFVEALAKS